MREGFGETVPAKKVFMPRAVHEGGGASSAIPLRAVCCLSGLIQSVVRVAGKTKQKNARRKMASHFTTR